ncbi:hypothetical protein FSST1_012554 [Fusarium sambucinum]
MTALSDGTASATAIGDPRSTNAGLSIVKPTKTGDAKGSDETKTRQELCQEKPCPLSCLDDGWDYMD